MITVMIIILNAMSINCLTSAFLEKGLYSKFAQNITNALSGDSLSISAKCNEHILRYAENLLSEELWALEMFDSISKLPSGLLMGRLTDLGSFDECLSVNGKLNTTNTIFGKYCLATIPMNLKGIRETNELVKITVVSLWFVAIATICACLLAGHHLIVEYERTGSALHMGLVKPCWAIGISLMIYACICGYGGPINWFLSLPFFEVLSKLTYTIYLSHFALISIMIGQMRETTTFDNLQTMHAFWGDFAFTLAASVILMLSFELPMITIEKFVLGRWENEYKNGHDRGELDSSSVA